MKLVTKKYKIEIKKYGRQLDTVITYNDGKEHLLDSDVLFSITPVVNGNILKSVMKELSFESSVKVPKGTTINVKFGVLVNLGLTVAEVNAMKVNRLNSMPVKMLSTLKGYEYINLGNYIVAEDPEYNADTFSYTHICYDKMLYTMKNYEKLDITYPISIRNYINKTCEHLGLAFKNFNDTFANYDKQIKSDLYDGYDYTFRDIFDELAQVTASTICINENTDELEVRYINDTQDMIDEDYLKDTNVGFKEKYGPINSVVLSRAAESDNVFLRDEQSVKTNGLCEIKIIDNQIMNGNDRSDFLPDILEKLNGLEYYINDFDSTGITWYELCDKYTVKIGENLYNCVLFNDEIKITQGLEESIYTEMPETSETDYSKADKTDRKINKAYIMVDKQNQKIESVVSQQTETGNKLTQVEQTVDGITQSVSEVETKIETVETKADNAQSSANNAQDTADSINESLTTNYYTKTETNSQISQKANEITSTVSETYSTKTETTNAKNEAINSANASTDEKLKDYSTTKEMNSAITQKADSITQEVTQKVENIQIGGTNLIPNSAPYNLDGYVISNTTYIERTLEDEETAPFGKCIRIRSLTDLPSMLGVYIIPIPQVLDEGKEYCFSLWLKATAPTNVTVGYARGGQTTFNVTTEYKKFTHKFTALAPTSEAHGFAIYLPAGTVPGRQVFVHSIKLEEGNKNTDWSPAPSDVASKEEMNSKIEQTANKIEMTVQQEINTITGENSIRNGTFENGLQNWNIFASQGDVQVTEYGNKKYAELITMNGETKLTQTITGLIEEIDYKLSFKVLSKSFIPTGTTFTTKIWQTKNNSEELILLKSQEVELNETEKSTSIEFNMLYAGDVDIEFGLNISSFSSEEISAMVTDVVVAGGSISERFASLKVGLDGIESEVSKKVGNNEVISKINQSSETVGINANKIELSANDVLNLLAGNTINLSGKSIKISSNNFNVDANGKMTCKGAEISGKVIVGGDEEEPEFIATDGNFRTTVFPLGLLNEVNGKYAAVMKGGLGVGTYTSTGMSEKVTINSEGIIAPKVTQTSLAEQKKNFEKMKDNALNIIKTIDIYKYNLKNEKNTDKKHIGFVIGDNYKYSKEVTSIDNTGVDNYSFTSLCCKAIQEQQQQIEQLQKEIQELRKEET